MSTCKYLGPAEHFPLLSELLVGHLKNDYAGVHGRGVQPYERGWERLPANGQFPGEPGTWSKEPKTAQIKHPHYFGLISP